MEETENTETTLHFDGPDKCWFCGGPDCDAFDWEFDTPLHLECLRKELVSPIKNSEARFMRYLLEEE